MTGPGPACWVPASHPGECLGEAVRVYPWCTPTSLVGEVWSRLTPDPYGRKYSKPENVLGAELLRHHVFWVLKVFTFACLGPGRQGINPGTPETPTSGFKYNARVQTGSLTRDIHVQMAA